MLSLYAQGRLLWAAVFCHVAVALEGLRPISANLSGKELKSERTLVFASPTHHKNVILRACDFFDLFVF
jgi:hypothetical protein